MDPEELKSDAEFGQFDSELGPSFPLPQSGAHSGLGSGCLNGYESRSSTYLWFPYDQRLWRCFGRCDMPVQFEPNPTRCGPRILNSQAGRSNFKEVSIGMIGHGDGLAFVALTEE